tara:strand:- start:1969 stop:2319 length:351 start_codon:yes stop_codon:yes gene_type:complete
MPTLNKKAIAEGRRLLEVNLPTPTKNKISVESALTEKHNGRTIDNLIIKANELGFEKFFAEQFVNHESTYLETTISGESSNFFTSMREQHGTHAIRHKVITSLVNFVEMNEGLSHA